MLRLGGLAGEGDNGGRRGEAGAVVLLLVERVERGGGGTARAGSSIISGVDVLLVSPPCVRVCVGRVGME